MNLKYIIPALLVSSVALAQTSASGYVFEDSNKNEKKTGAKKE